jgi:hypothetical protein
MSRTVPDHRPRADAATHDLHGSPVGAWRNELGSRLRLAGTPTGGLSGTFASAVGTTRGRRPVVGFRGHRLVDGSSIVGFVVRWPRSGSIAAWSGRYDAAEDRIHAMWLLVDETGADNVWRSTTMGADDFERKAPRAARTGEAPDDLRPTHLSRPSRRE